MHDALDPSHTLSSLAVSASLRDGTTEASPTAPPAHAASGLLRWLIPTHILRHSDTDPAPLDEHTLSDIGLSRMDMLYSDSKK
ncbi:hypothetical protein FQV39_22525 [Bosea sp. F3-2]|uniref:hypothetical protein n=1 Tax=Bosea sp. F3-2 TaxID=2599640 RepID=UPI0011EC2A05|nr:hypothetical protein [Bosea sp. F3-2]QEL25063.1 hypothetical protein FQV39_22525 [Bosea sp. F3-2]